jgi:hypothetical protein
VLKSCRIQFDIYRYNSTQQESLDYEYIRGLAVPTENEQHINTDVFCLAPYRLPLAHFPIIAPFAKRLVQRRGYTND